MIDIGDQLTIPGPDTELAYRNSLAGYGTPGDKDRVFRQTWRNTGDYCREILEHDRIASRRKPAGKPERDLRGPEADRGCQAGYARTDLHASPAHSHRRSADRLYPQRRSRQLLLLEYYFQHYYLKGRPVKIACLFIYRFSCRFSVGESIADQIDKLAVGIIMKMIFIIFMIKNYRNNRMNKSFCALLVGLVLVTLLLTACSSSNESSLPQSGNLRALSPVPASSEISFAMSAARQSN